MSGERLSLGRARYHWPLYLFILPCVVFVGLFMYYPVVNGVYHSMYFWNGGDVERYYGFRNFLRLFNITPAFWDSFTNALILGTANIFKMAPAIITAVCLHRVRSERLQFVYRALFVVPMVVPFAVVVLLWKQAFYEPTQGVVNVVLRETGLLNWLVGISSTAGKVEQLLVPDLFSAGGVQAYLIGALAGAALIYLFCLIFANRDYGHACLLGYLVGLGGLAGAVLGVHTIRGVLGSRIGGVCGALLAGALVYRISQRLSGVRDLALKDRVVAGLLCALLGSAGLSLIVQYTRGFFGWLAPLFPPGENPAWLGTPKLCMISLVLWGFPWVGSFSVLVYLATLQQIGREIYEAAEVDGADWFHKFRHIELPLIVKQVRVLMILVIMGSINDAGMVMLMGGIEGGPGGVVQVPALFMFREAFQSQAMGVACAIGLVMFTIIVLMTKVNEWLVKPGE